MRTVLYPGSFDPVTVGHMDIIQRAAERFDRVVIGVLHNPQKPSGRFTVAERIALLTEVASPLGNVRAQAFSGLLVDAARACGADAVLRGIRSVSDMDSEMQMARLNRQIGGVETLFLAAAPEVIHVSAEMVRQIGSYGGDLRGLVPEAVRGQIAMRLLNKDG